MTTRPTIDLPLDDSSAVLRLTPYAGTDVREGGRYAYRFVDLGREIRRLEPTELFRRRPDDPMSGDFLPRECVGTVAIVCTMDDGERLETSVEVLPTKLRYETEYRAMLDQIADHAAEAILQGYAPASASVSTDGSGTAQTRYRVLAFLAARLRDETFRAALLQVRHRPHRGWEDIVELRPLGAGSRATSEVSRALQLGGRSVPIPRQLQHLPMRSVPAEVESTHSAGTFDTPANRFVRYVFSRWLSLALDALSAVRAEPRVGAGPRGRAEEEAEWVATTCEEMLSTPPLRDAGPMRTFRAADQVLLRRGGYREVLRAFALAETTVALDVELPDDAFSATQRNVAALYEYWCFAALARVMSAVSEAPPAGLLFTPSATGLSLVLRQGEASRLTWDLQVDDRALVADLWFNRSFEPGDDPSTEIGSWAGRLRPDASLRIRPKSARPHDAIDPDLDVWVHFDAKYRIEALTLDTALDDADGAGDAATPARPTTARREDLLKMHAYRDAIHRSAGAYVLYPGSGSGALRREFHEVLPGLGAFPLRPGQGGAVDGADDLESFIRDVARHVANQASAMERTQYWSARYNRGPGRRVRPVDFLSRPPADTTTLLGYVRRPQIEWVVRTKLYNLRVGDRPGAVDLTDDMLGAELIVLWAGSPRRRSIVGAFERTGPWQVTTAEELSNLGYPTRHANARYLVTAIEPLHAAVERLISLEAVTQLTGGHPVGAPTTTTWDVVSS
jgi:hypothetical protein